MSDSAPDQVPIAVYRSDTMQGDCYGTVQLISNTEGDCAYRDCLIQWNSYRASDSVFIFNLKECVSKSRVPASATEQFLDWNHCNTPWLVISFCSELYENYPSTRTGAPRSEFGANPSTRTGASSGKAKYYCVK
jgi:hypothetical protein